MSHSDFLARNKYSKILGLENLTPIFENNKQIRYLISADDLPWKNTNYTIIVDKLTNKAKLSRDYWFDEIPLEDKIHTLPKKIQDIIMFNIEIFR